MAYTVLLADDNQMAIEALRHTIPWEKMGLTLVGCAYNGRQGCEMIEQFRPDIIISDIHMPEMDGLAMIEAMQKSVTNSRVIFITAYEKFEYASQAIKLAAFDFILKPIDDAELLKTLERAVISLRKESDEAQRGEQAKLALQRVRMLSALNRGVSEGCENVLATFLDDLPVGYFMIAAETGTSISGPVLQRLEYVTFPPEVQVVSTVADGELVLFCGIMDPEAPWQVMARRVADLLLRITVNMTVAVSALHTEPFELHIAYQEARSTLLRHNLYGRHSQLEFFGSQGNTSSRHTRLADLEQVCTKLAQKVDTLDAEQVWQTIWEKSAGKLRIIRIMLMFFCTKVMQDKIDHLQYADTIDMTVFDITKLESDEAAKNWLTRFFGEIQKGDVPANSGLVRNVLDYVRSRVTEGLVLEDVAKEFYVSPNYLSALIRKETGITYRQHVINAKIAVAKQMLDDTRMRVEDIAYAVGYENYISFYNVFKKMEKMSPTEYRFSNRGEK